MDYVVFLDLAFDLCRVVGFRIGLAFAPDSRGREHLF